VYTVVPILYSFADRPFAGVVGVGVPPVVPPPVVVVVFVSSGAVSSFFLQEKINALTNAIDNADFNNVDVFIFLCY
jgi:hypothetical protein